MELPVKYPPRFEELDKHKIVARLKSLRRQGWYWDVKKGKITADAGYDWDSCWVHFKKQPHTRCPLYHKVIFSTLGVFPTFCLNCWKVVCRPPNFHKFIECMPKMYEWYLPSKMGVAARFNTFGLYQCYFYNDSLEQAKEREEFVRKHFDPSIEIYTKRFCTEYEEAFGRSDEIEVTDEMTEVTKIIEEYVDWPINPKPQPPLLVEHIIKEWMVTASQSGDKSVLKYTKPIHTECLRY